MLTTSKKWAIVTGFAVVFMALAFGALRSVPGGPMLSLVDRPAASPPQPSTAAAPPHPPKPMALQRVPGSAPESTAELEPKGMAEVKPSSPPQAQPPRFDVVRVEPSGEMVLAGQGAPDTIVALVGGGQVLAEVRADAGGHFAMLPPPLKAGDYALTLRQSTQGAAPVSSAQSVAVSIPARGKGAVVVALAEPGAPTRLLSAPPLARGVAAPPPDRPSAKDQPLVVRSVELENGSGFYATGAAAPGTKLRVYLNNSHLADVAASADGQWSVKIRRGLTGGHYVVRADSANEGAAVTARAEVPFDVPPGMADVGPVARTPRLTPDSRAPQPTSPTGDVAANPFPPNTSSATNAVIEEVSTAAVRSGDNLWDISRVRLGQGRRYTRIYAANATQIRDPRLIYPGQVFVLPAPGD